MHDENLVRFKPVHAENQYCTGASASWIEHMCLLYSSMWLTLQMLNISESVLYIFSVN